MARYTYWVRADGKVPLQYLFSGLMFALQIATSTRTAIHICPLKAEVINH